MTDEEKSSISVRVDSNGIIIGAARGRTAPAYVAMGDLVGIIDALDKILDKWDGSEMEPGIYRLALNGA
jgi:hypothetical protein